MFAVLFGRYHKRQKGCVCVFYKSWLCWGRSSMCWLWLVELFLPLPNSSPWVIWLYGQYIQCVWVCVRVLERYYQTHTHAHVPNDLTCFAVKNRGERCLQDAVDGARLPWWCRKYARERFKGEPFFEFGLVKSGRTGGRFWFTHLSLGVTVRESKPRPSFPITASCLRKASSFLQTFSG